MLHEERRKRIIIITVIIIALALISLVPLLKQRNISDTFTGNTIAANNSPINKAVNYSYLFLLIIVPIAGVGMLSYAYIAKKQTIDSSFDVVLHLDEQKQKETIVISLDEYLQEMNSKNTPSVQLHEYDVDVLQTHIKTKLLRGYSTEEVYYELIKHGWKKEKISQSLKEMSITPTEAELILGSFMAKSLSQGHDLVTVKESLLAKGWQPELIESCSKRFEESVRN